MPVIIVGASTQVGLSIVQELTQGSHKQFFRVVAATLKNEKPEKIERLRSLRCEMLEYSPDQMHSVEDFLKHHGIKAMILAGTSHDDTKEIKAWMDSGRRVRDSSYCAQTIGNRGLCSHALNSLCRHGTSYVCQKISRFGTLHYQQCAILHHPSIYTLRGHPPMERR